MTGAESYASPPGERRGGIRFDRNELAGAFGDIGTDLPLIFGMILAAGLHSASVLIAFGLMQVVTAFAYRVPMPVQPLKAVAVIVITQKVAPDIVYGGGLAIGLLMLALSASGAIDWLARTVPKAVVRGLQLGLGMQLAMLALRDYVQSDGSRGFILAAIAFAVTIALWGNRKIPPALPVIALGVAYALFFKLDAADFSTAAGFALPQIRPVTWDAIATGFLLLALPQIPLSLGNSILATRQIAEDLYPEKRIGVRKLSFTYAAMNLVNPFFGGVPTCHGSGGLVGHYTFGARTGGSIIIYGSIFLVLGLFFSRGFAEVVQIFPLPVLGVLLMFEGAALMSTVRDQARDSGEFFIAVITGLIAVGVPYGYAAGLVIGTVLFYLQRARGRT
jgi:hypothetical protein